MVGVTETIGEYRNIYVERTGGGCGCSTCVRWACNAYVWSKNNIKLRMLINLYLNCTLLENRSIRFILISIGTVSIFIFGSSVQRIFVELLSLHLIFVMMFSVFEIFPSGSYLFQKLEKSLEGIDDAKDRNWMPCQKSHIISAL
jgi:hypothetical protein